MGSERRRNERKRVLREARWESMSHTHEVRVDDVSLGGCFVNTYGKVELGEHVDLQIQLPSGSWLPVRGRVASYQPGVGFGMSFESLNQQEMATLKKLLATSKDRKL
jgi:hypothetical protein